MNAPERFTCRTIAKALQRRFPEFKTIELRRGNGYFYFGDVVVRYNGRDRDLQVDSIYVNALHQMSFEKWVDYAADNLRNAMLDAGMGVQS